MKTFTGRTAVITGAGSGFGLETSRIAAARGMNVVMADVQQDALDRAAAEIARARRRRCWRSGSTSPRRPRSRRSARAIAERFGAPHIVFNNAGVGAGGLIWENTLADWEWVLGVNVMGVAHGIRVFTPMMLEAAAKDPAYEGHIVNTASMAGLLNPPNMGVYNVSKHAVVSMSETLYQDLRLVTEQISASVLCPFFVPTGISASERNRPESARRGQADHEPADRQGDERPGGRQRQGQRRRCRPVRVRRDRRADRFYIYSHPKALGSVQTRLEDVVQARNPTDPFAGKPEIGAELRAKRCAPRTDAG